MSTSVESVAGNIEQTSATLQGLARSQREVSESAKDSVRGLEQSAVGLQELDFEMGGLPGADVVLTVGLDEAEAPRRLWAKFPHRSVAPELLGPLAEQWEGRRPLSGMPPLRERKVDDIAEILVETAPGGQALTTVEPATVLAAKFSIPHAIAATARLGTAGARAFTFDKLDDEAIARLRRRVRLAPYRDLKPWPKDRPARGACGHGSRRRATRGSSP